MHHPRTWLHTMQAFPSLVPRPSPQLSSLAARILLRVIRTASDDSCGEGLGTRLGLPRLQLFVRSACYIPCRPSPSPVICTQRMLHTMQAFPVSSYLYAAHATYHAGLPRLQLFVRSACYIPCRPSPSPVICTQRMLHTMQAFPVSSYLYAAHATYHAGLPRLQLFVRSACYIPCRPYAAHATYPGLPHLQLFVRSACYIPCRPSPSPVICTQRMLHTMQAFPISSCLYAAHATSDQSKVETVRVKKSFFYSHSRAKKRRILTINPTCTILTINPTCTILTINPTCTILTIIKHVSLTKWLYLYQSIDM